MKKMKKFQTNKYLRKKKVLESRNRREHDGMKGFLNNEQIKLYSITLILWEFKKSMLHWHLVLLHWKV
jgi:hypothetical protein